MLSATSATESRPARSRAHRRMVANEASSYSAPSSERNSSKVRPSACVSRMGALRTRIPSPLLRTQKVESPAATRNSADGSRAPAGAPPVHPMSATAASS